MNIVIPCGGLGDRFAKDGYIDPKPLIPAMGRPILSWLLEGLPFSKDDTLLVAYNVDLEKWRMEDRLRECVGGRIPVESTFLDQRQLQRKKGATLCRSRPPTHPGASGGNAQARRRRQSSVRHLPDTPNDGPSSSRINRGLENTSPA